MLKWFDAVYHWHVYDVGKDGGHYEQHGTCCERHGVLSVSDKLCSVWSIHKYTFWNLHPHSLRVVLQCN
jgi:hypothetical protein